MIGFSKLVGTSEILKILQPTVFKGYTKPPISKEVVICIANTYILPYNNNNNYYYNDYYYYY